VGLVCKTKLNFFGGQMPWVRAIPKIRALRQGVVEFGPTFKECPPHVGLTHPKT